MKLNQTMKDKEGNQVLLYPSPVISITQSANGTISHMGTISMDDNSGNTGITQWYAPCDLKLVMIMDWAENPLIFQSLKPVRMVNGELSHVTIRTMHEDDISKYKVGDIFRQGEVWVKEGNAGNSFGNHVHYEIVKGLTTTLKLSSEGKYSLGLVGENSLADSFFAVNDTPVLETSYTGIKMNWKEYDGKINGGGTGEKHDIISAIMCGAFPYNFT